MSYIILRLKIDQIYLYHAPQGGLINAITYLFPGKTVHYFTGQRWATFKGLRLFLFKFLDFIIIKLADKTYADSFRSQISYLRH